MIIFFILAGSLYTKAFSADPFHLEFYADSEKTVGTRLAVPYFEFRFNTRFPKESFGLSFSTKKFSVIPFTMKVGNLSEGGSISALKNPMLSAGTSPFSNGITSVTGISANLPGYTSFSKAVGVFVQAEFPFPVIINCFAAEDLHEPTFSLLFSHSFLSKVLTFKFSSTSGSFLSWNLFLMFCLTISGFSLKNLISSIFLSPYSLPISFAIFFRSSLSKNSISIFPPPAGLLYTLTRLASEEASDSSTSSK